MPKPEAANARSLALETVKRVEKDNAYLDRLIDNYQNKNSLKEVDRRLFAELAYGTVRHRRLLDFYIEQVLDRKIAQTDLATRNILRLGAYQLLFLDKIPARAAVNESVELSARHARPIINAVLRKLSERKSESEKPGPAARKNRAAGREIFPPGLDGGKIRQPLWRGRGRAAHGRKQPAARIVSAREHNPGEPGTGA